VAAIVSLAAIPAFGQGTWTAQTPAAHPSGLNAPATAYDRARANVVLFGGYNGSDWTDATWTWSGSNWTLRSPATKPPKRYLASMGYDAVHGEVVMFGGYGGAFLGDTWTWNGTTWAKKLPAHNPPTGAGGMMAYDEARDRGLDKLDAAHLFAPSTTRLALRRGTFLRGYVYDFIARFAPKLDRATVDAALASAPARAE